MKKIFYTISCSVLFFTFHLNAQTANIDFELSTPGVYTTPNAVNGWTVSSQTNTNSCSTSSIWTPGSPEFSIVSTPIIAFPVIGNILNSPLGGTNVARLNNSTANGSVTRLTRTYSVTSSNSLLKLAWAGVWDGNHYPCCENSTFNFFLKDFSGNLLSCSSISMTPGIGCQSSGITFSTSINGQCWSNWQVKNIDLSPYINSTVIIEIVCGDCSHGDHVGTLFFDAIFPYTPPNVSFCSGSPYAYICGPVGEATYSWVAAGPIPFNQSTLSCLTIPNPYPGANYTLNVFSPTGCAFTFTYSLIPTTITIGATTSSPTCPGGSGGSATIIASGSPTGYNYNWINSTNSVVGTSSVVTGLAPGIYTVTTTAFASPGCGSPSTTVSIGTATVASTLLFKPFCGTEAYLSFPGGTNYQWYNNLTPITASLGGTASNYTVANGVNGAIYTLGYDGPYGCRDSLEILLLAIAPGFVSVSHPTICSGSANGVAVISLSPAYGGPVGINSYSVFSTGTTPFYNATLNPTNANTFSASGLTAGGTYSVKVFDGLCKYVKGFSVIPLSFNYTLTPSSVTVCSGNTIQVGVAFISQPAYAQYSYSWSPNIFLASTTLQNNNYSPLIAPGTSTTITYSVIVTSSPANCSLTKTIAITAVNPITPNIAPIPTLCANAGPYTLTTNPVSGLSYNINSISPNGILNTFFASVGMNTFMCSNSIGSCVASTQGSFVIVGPNLGVSSNTAIFCGQTLTLSASGANAYVWNNASTNSSIVITPTNTSAYYVTGTNYTSTCSKTSTINVIVTSSTALSITGNFSLCSGNSATLNVSGSDTYLWNNANASFPLILSPTATNLYSLTGVALNGCQTNSLILITVNPLPTIFIGGNTSICPGRYTVLTANGANSYNWNTGATSPIISLTPNVTSNYTVTGTDSFGCVGSAIITVTVEGCVGIENYFDDKLEMKIYPNPTNDKLTIETKNDIRISLRDELGRIILEKDLQQGNYNLDLSNYISGIYLLSIKNEDSLKIIKLIKTN